MEELCKSIEDHQLEYLDDILFELKSLLKISLISETQEELYHVLSHEINNIYTDIVYKGISKKDMDKIYNFISENYFNIFLSYFKKNNFISKLDYNDCVVSLSKNFSIKNNESSIIVSKWIEDNIIKN